MGWASAGEIFDPVAQALINSGADEYTKRTVLGPLIRQLQAGDWDTEDESLHEFKNDPVIVALFKKHGVVLEDTVNIGPVTPTTMRVAIDVTRELDITDDVRELAVQEGLTYEEILSEVKKDPYGYFDYFISDIDYEHEFEFEEN